MSKEGWCVRLGQEEGSLRESGEKLGGIEEGSGNKNFKRGGQAGLRGGCLKKRGCWNPLTNYGDVM